MSEYCGRCDRSFVDYRALRMHLDASSSHWECYLCSEDLWSRRELEQHEEDDHWPCSTCGNVLCDKEDWDEHQQEQHPPTCEACNRTFSTNQGLISHLRSPIHVKPVVVVKNFSCPIASCGKAFTAPSAVLLHLESGQCPSKITRHIIDRYVTQHPGANLITNPARQITSYSANDPHTRFVEPDPPFIASDAAWNSYSRAYECYLCNQKSGQSKLFDSLRNLNAHLASPRHVTGEKLYRCPNGACGLKIATLSGLCQHIENGSCGVRKFRAVQGALEGVMNAMSGLSIGYR